MRITILALGSRGDVQPYVALGVGLQRAGHAVRVVTFENFAPLVQGAGLDFYPVRGDVQAMLSGSANMAEVGSNPIRLYQNVRTTFAVQMQDYRDAFSAAALLDSEVIINQLPANLFGYDLAEKLGIPYF